jgi:hypothetical protein
MFHTILENVVEIFSGLLAPPKLFVSEAARGFRYENPDGRFSVSISVGVKTVPRSLLMHPLPISARRNDWKLCQTLDTAIRPDGRYAMQTFAV